ncbi:MarR family winged helix-turn-helix transcriptional regulator [Thioalkalivibrio paradoxus]|uniref:MarR family transcriptional regulator n=1 Tax=Thioalkalivibrio paradoxus ARh 1 TaxID=713585 RepID=W0DMF0_9GAMM|nr:MarR family transcriptional regulator [Thioalkalivibrio paradoxus]AHE99749.1 MarR family transcriptional regulator [Thioalkalivibrio paradoxus ARh 1]
MSAPDGASPSPDGDRTETVHSVIRQLRVIIRALQGHSRSVQRSCGISAAQLWALWEVRGSPGLNVGDLSRRLSVHPSTTSNLLDKLEQAGLIERMRRQRDQRIVRVFVTPAGDALLERAPAAPQGELNRALHALDPAELAALNVSLHALVGHMASAEPMAGLQPFDGGG